MWAVIILFPIHAIGAPVFSGQCYQTSGTAEPGKYYVVDYGITGYSETTIPSITTVYPNCTSGTKYKIIPYNYTISTSSELYGTIGIVYSCTACKSGYKLATKSGPYVYGTTDSSINCTSVVNTTIKDCVLDASSITSCTTSNCKSDTSWQSHNAAYVKKTIRTCSSDKTTCNENTIYACNYGYYGTSSSTTASGCSQCPPYVIGTKSYSTTTNLTGATSMTACYVVAEAGVTTFEDITGTFVLNPYSPPMTACFYSLGNCATYYPVCTTSAGTIYRVVNETKANNTSGTHCWCNTNNKSFYAANMNTYATCNQSCKTACITALTGHSASNWHPMVSLTDLGC